ncbi:hypothetical protein [Roseateles sp.]|uniref:hypothetical protein n=1 Tax=Roseateles sp. TaxID=1971397 RepID=UPI00286A1309|nr:hypothetical protein [Roseateles sp.]
MRHLLAPVLLSVLSVLSGTALAHEGHGFSGTHWHAGDLLGLLVLAIVGAGGALWWSRRK